MRSLSKLAPLGCALAILMVGCAHVDVNSPQIRGMAYVHLNTVLKHDPLYPQLSRINDAIAAIDLAAAVPHAPLTAAQITTQTKVLDREMQSAQDRASKIVAQARQTYNQRENSAIAAALSAAGIAVPANVGAQMSATSIQQARATAIAAGRDFAAYQQSVSAEDRAASTAIAKQLQAQAAQKIKARAMQYQQDETDLSLKLSQRDATQRLAIETKLNNLAMDDATRTKLNSQLAALNASEQSQLDALKQIDAAALQTYAKGVQQAINAQIRTQVNAISAQSRVKLEARRNQVGAELRSLGPAPLPNLPPNVKAQILQIQQQNAAGFQNSIQKTVSDYNATKADLDRQFEALHGADVGATGAAAKQLASLQEQHDDLAKQMLAQITREAGRLAKERGFKLVIDNVNAAPGGYDMTNDLIKDIESQHE